MKRRLKKILKWTGITLLLLIIALILIPIIFKDQIKEMVVDEVNKNLNAELKVGDFDLTFFSTFPNMTVQLHDTKLTGKKEFKGVELISMEKMTAHVGFWSVVFGDKIEIDEIHIEKPIIDIRILEDGKANYDIVKPDEEKTKEELEEPSSFELSLKEYSITDGKIKYDDKLYDMYMNLDNIQHTGKGDLTAEVFDFETSTQIEKVTYRMYGMNYLTEVNTDAKVNLLMEMKEDLMKFTLKDNTFKLNKVTCSLDGYYAMHNGYDDMNLKLNASKTSFKDFLSLIPAFYRTGYESMISSGNLSLNGVVKGKMDDTNMPGWDFGMKVSGGSVKYAGLPGKISNIQIDAGSKFPGGSDFNKMTVDMPKFHANLGENTIDANLFMSNLEVDPRIKSGIHSHVNLATIKNFVPMPSGESLSGILDANVDLDGALSSLENEEYDKFKAEGVLELSNMIYASESMNEDALISRMKFTFSPQALQLNELDAKMGKSDFQMDGIIDEYLAYALGSAEVDGQPNLLKGSLNFSSNFMDLDELMNVYPEGEATEIAETSSESTEGTEPTLVPAGIDFALNTKITEAKYNGITAKNVSGMTGIKDEVATLKDFSLNAMGGTIGLAGNYDTRDHNNPKFDFSYTLQNIDIQELATNFITIEKLAPITKYAQGRISSNLSMNSDLDNNLMPILKSITSNGNIQSNSIALTGVPLLEKIEKVTKLKNISNKTVENFKTFFTVSDGKVELTPFNTKLGKIPTKISGYTTLEKDMNYKFEMDIPKDEIPAVILNEVEKGLTMLNGLHPDLKVGDLPPSIKANVFAKGDPKNPTITTDLTDQVKAAVKDKMGNLVDDAVNTVKDSVQTIIDDKKEDIKEDIEAKKKELLDAAQKKADQVKAEGKKAGDAIRAEAKKQGDALIKEAGNNPVKKKLAEASAKKLQDAAEKKAQGVEAEANKKADDIMRKAREEADRL